MRSTHLSVLAAAAVCLAGASAHAQPHKLLISEIIIDCINPETSTDSGEWMEIYNPNEFAVDLEDYYITDTQFYWTFTTAVDNYLAMAASDHLVGFPTGSSIPPHGIVVVTQTATRFLTDYLDGNLATFTSLPGSPQLFQVGEATPPVGVEIMRNFHATRTGDHINNFSKTNAGASAGEFKVLFYWDGNPANNIVDIDMVSWGGDPITTASNNFLAKDPGTTAPGYALDAGSHSNLTVGVFNAIYRISTDEPGQPTTGGNGIGGADESLEICNESNPSSSWRGLAIANVPSYTNNDLLNPDGVTPGVSPLQPTADVAQWSLYHY